MTQAATCESGMEMRGPLRALAAASSASSNQEASRRHYALFAQALSKPILSTTGGWPQAKRPSNAPLTMHATRRRLPSYRSGSECESRRQRHGS
jgi:hypothetical protein